MAHNVFAVIKQLQRKLRSRFLQTRLLDNLTEDVIDDENNYLPSEDIFLGLVTRNLWRKKVEDGDLALGQHDKFIKAAIAFYRESLRYTLLKMNVDSSFWEMAQWIDFDSHQNAKWYHVEYFVEKYKVILQYDDYEMDKLFEEFIDFKSLSDSELPSAAWEDATVKEFDDGSKEYKIVTLWYHIQQLRSLAGKNQRFELLFKVAKVILITLHSNAGIERIFSLVSKNKSAGSDSNRLNIEGSLPSILAVQMERPESEEKRYCFKPSDELFNSAKKATYTYNKSKGQH